MLALELRRKLFHLIAISLWLIPIKFFPYYLVLVTFIFVIMLNILVTIGTGRDLFKRVYQMILYFEREKNIERPGIQAIWANLGIMLSFLLFGRDCSAVGVVLLAVGDTFATLVGTHIGRVKFFEKTLEGSFAFFFCSFCVLYFMIGWEKALVISSLGAIAEVLPLKLDDNFSVPVIGSFVCFVLEHT